MFNHIRRRLVILNTLVFLLVLTLLSSLLFVHMRFRLLHDMDEILEQAKLRIQSVYNLSELLESSHPAPQQDERTTYLFWDKAGQWLGQSPPQSLTPEIASTIQHLAEMHSPQTLSLRNHEYRVLQTRILADDRGSSITVSIVRSLEDVNHTLDSLLRDLMVGIIAGGLISVLAGLFLAGRALVPIRNSWDKQQRFVADASHELRTPTAIIHAETELLLQHPTRSIEEESPHIAVILQESKRMKKLLDDLLTLARTDSNQLQIDSAMIRVDHILCELAEQFNLLAATKDIQIDTEVDEPLWMWGDQSRMRQLLIILLDNALKYTPVNGQIRITGRYQLNEVYISISDTGIGIPKEDLPYIFERFYRGDKVRSRMEGGTGLGLSIARWIAEVHEGTIRVHSESARGTKVQLFFPRKK